jgi:hypothetical protein
MRLNRLVLASAGAVGSAHPGAVDRYEWRVMQYVKGWMAGSQMAALGKLAAILRIPAEVITQPGRS